MQTLDHGLLYPEEILAKFASRLLEEAGSHLTVDTAVWAHDDYVTIVALDDKNKVVRLAAPVVEFHPGIISFRSILEGLRMEPLWNESGAAAEETSEIAFYGDEGPKLIASRDTLADYFRSGKPSARQDPAGYRGFMESVLQERLKGDFYHRDFEVAYIDGDRFPLDLARAPQMAA